MNQAELNVTLTALKSQLEVFERITVCCHSCLSYERGKCLHHQATPPPEWVHGPIQCAHWQHDNVPF